MSGSFASIACILLAAAVGLGAFGAHALKAKLDAPAMALWEKAVHYHFLHALGLLAAGLTLRDAAKAACWLLIFGILLFSGSLYALALSGVSTLGAVTPLGGVCFIAAWVLLAVRLGKRG